MLKDCCPDLPQHSFATDLTFQNSLTFPWKKKFSDQITTEYQI